MLLLSLSSQAQPSIDRIVEQIEKSHSTQRQHTQHLADTEQKITDTVREQNTIQQQLRTTQLAYTQVQAQYHQLQDKLTQEQQALANLVRLRYELPTLNPWQQLINHTSPKTINRTLAYQHYLMQAHMTLVNTTQQTQREVEQASVLLQQTKQQLLQFKHQLLAREIQLRTLKANQTHLLTAARQEEAELTQQLHGLTRPVQNQRVKPSLLNPLANHASPSQPLKQGLIFYAPEGSPVKAVLPGKIIFSDWLNGYGLLLIVDHGNGLMSVYAHNQALLKLKGTEVTAGVPIARVGHTGDLQKNGLYFELRRHGKVIPPGEWIA
jgi:septal ring factor EnvC (AmiA/AmiB activator)